MKWIGTTIKDFITRFRGDVYLQEYATTSDTNILVLNSDNKICVNESYPAGDITGIAIESDGDSYEVASGNAAFGIKGGEGIDTSLDGSDIVIAGENASSSNIGVASFAAADFSVSSGAVSLADITVSHLAAAAIQTSSESFTDNDTSLMTSTAIKEKIEDYNYITSSVATLWSLTTIGSAGANTNFLAGDVSIFNPVNDGNPTFRIGSTTTECLRITASYGSGAQNLQTVNFDTLTASATADMGSFQFSVDGQAIAFIDDDGIRPYGSAVIKGTSGRRHGDIIKILPTDFIQNEDGGVNKSHQLDDTGTFGVRATSTDAELWAFINIPEGMKATHTHIKGLDSGSDGSSVDDFVIEVFSYSLSNGGTTSLGTGVVGTNLNHTDLTATATNCLAIRVDTADIAGSDTDVVYGGYVTVAMI